MGFITVKHGSNEEHLFNPNCLSAVLLTHIRHRCHLDAITEPLDLASEAGEVVDLAGKPKEYAKKYLEPRGTYVVVKVCNEDEDDMPPSYQPLLETSDRIKFAVKNPTNLQKTKKFPTSSIGDSESRKLTGSMVFGPGITGLGGMGGGNGNGGGGGPGGGGGTGTGSGGKSGGGGAGGADGAGRRMTNGGAFADKMSDGTSRRAKGGTADVRTASAAKGPKNRRASVTSRS